MTTHVLDTSTGRPAEGVEVVLETMGGERLGGGRTDADGRLRELGPDHLPAGAYRIVFGTGEWFSSTGRACFHPQVAVSFTVTDGEHYHVPLLLSQFAYSTYRGS